MTTKKMTKKEMFAQIMANYNLTDEERAFVQHEIELLEKKSSKSGQTKTQKENEILMEQLVGALGEMEKAVTISEFQGLSKAEVATLSNQKISALLKKLVESGKVVKTVEKKKSYFSVVQQIKWGLFPTP